MLKNTTLTKRKKIYQKLLQAHGQAHQMNKLKEECAELIVAISHMGDKNPIKRNITNLIDELADVRIMVEQIEYIFDIEEIVQARMKLKLVKAIGSINDV